ncbi:hypothetical protein [Capnocytophaga cynodegmi]|uniref:Lipoprotein n=1 Tax=Capnocytophaga cynodegmi TaxID=28189 RepID=A0A0B7HFZ2_9FLAO|nr:hypothetical protein [Capnocytophaga cynodegmi]CEN37599.1 exported hypothetical protein [Capnocytophaga cynodegmi]
MKNLFLLLFSLFFLFSCEKDTSLYFHDSLDSRPYYYEFVLTVFNNSRFAGEEGIYEFEIFNGESLMYSVKLSKGDYFTFRLKENKNYRWIATQNDGYIFSPTIRTGNVYMNEDKMLSIP